MILVPLDLPFFRRCTVTFAIKNTSCIVALDIVGVAAAISGVHNDSIKLAPLVDVIDIGDRQRSHQHTDDNKGGNQHFPQKEIGLL